MRKLYITAVVLILGCASIQSPTGGDKDTEAPVMALDSNTFKTNSKPSEIVLEFNENVTINPALISFNPQLSPDPIYKVKNKRLTILLEPESLSELTTYSIRLNESIKDLNEGNVGHYPTLLFSTGSYIDSSDRIIQLNNFEKNDKVFLKIKNNTNTYNYNINNASTTISGIPNRTELTMQAFIDKNNNSEFDAQEKGNIVRSDSDSTGIYLITPNTKVLKLRKNSSTIYLTGLEKNELFNVSLPIFNDTVILNQISDTSLFINEFNSISAKVDSLGFYSLITQDKRTDADSNAIYLTTNAPIKSLNKDSIIITVNQDTINNYKLRIINKTSIKIEFDTLVNNAQVGLLNNAITYSNMKSNNKAIIPISYANIFTIELNNSKETSFSVLLYSAKNDLVHYDKIDRQQTKIIKLQKGTYKMVYYIDSNKDQYLNHPLENKPEEPLFILENISVIKGFSNVIKL